MSEGPPPSVEREGRSPPHEKGAIAFSQPADGQPVHEEKQGTTCKRKISPLHLSELAHRDVTGKTLHLSDAEFDSATIRAHLLEEGCEPCRRWFRNARRTYRRLQLAGKAPLRSDTTEPGPTPRLVVLLIQPLERAGGSNALRLPLDCRYTRTNSSGWEITLVHLSKRTGPAENDPALLQKFDNCRVTVKIVPHQGEPLLRQMALHLDANGDLVSSPCALAGLEPRQIASIVLQGSK